MVGFLVRRTPADGAGVSERSDTKANFFAGGGCVPVL